MAIIAAWIAVILFFGLGVAPNIFGVLKAEEGGITLAGDIVARILGALHYFGAGCGAIYLLLGLRHYNTKANWIVVTMLVLICVSQFGISNRLHNIRSAGERRGSIISIDQPSRVEFKRLHRLSTATEIAIFLLGIAALIVDARRRANN